MPLQRLSFLPGLAWANSRPLEPLPWRNRKPSPLSCSSWLLDLQEFAGPHNVPGCRGTALAGALSSRRCCPGTPHAMREQGLSLSRYWERFGAWANARDMSLVAYQVGLIFDALMCERDELAKATWPFLLAVSLNGTRMELGFQLTWLEEPPGSLYLPRTKGLARGRSFAPLASNVGLLSCWPTSKNWTPSRLAATARCQRAAPQAEEALAAPSLHLKRSGSPCM